MNMRSSHLWGTLLSAFLQVVIYCFPSYGLEVLLSDDFDGTPGSYIDSAKWKVPPGGDGASYGQTTVKTALGDLSTTDGSAAVLRLNTYFPGNTGDPNTDRAFGAEFQSRSSYAVGGGLVWEVRARLGSSLDGGSDPNGVPISAPPSGFVGGTFLFDVTNAFNAAGNPLIREEADIELLSKQATSILTNTFNDDGFVGPVGNSSLIASPVAGFSPYDYHDYKMEIIPKGASNQIKFYVDGKLIRTEFSSDAPDEAMTAHFNLWMPDSGFIEASDGNLSDGDPNGDQIYTMSVDSMSLTRINTSKGSNLLSNGDFNDDGGPTLVGAPISGWDLVFNNANVSDEIGGFEDPNGLAFKTFGFAPGGFANASGAFQDVVVSPGDEVSVSLVVNSPTSDSIIDPNTGIPKGVQNAEVRVRFLDGNDILAQRIGVPLANEDPDLVQDAWLPILVEGTAPAGTTHVNIQLAHISDTVGGAIFWDNIELSVLSVSVNGADFDGNGIVDGLDFLKWQLGESPNPFSAADLALWEAQYGGPPPLQANTSAVPEPSSLFLCSIAAGLLYRFRNRAISQRNHRRRPLEVTDLF